MSGHTDDWLADLYASFGGDPAALTEPPVEPEAKPKSFYARFRAYWRGFGEAEGWRAKVAHGKNGLWMFLFTVLLLIPLSGLLLWFFLMIVRNTAEDRMVQAGWHGFSSFIWHALYIGSLVLVCAMAIFFIWGWGSSLRRKDKEAVATWKQDREAAEAEIKRLKALGEAIPDEVQEAFDQKEPVIKPHYGWPLALFAVLVVGFALSALPYRHAETICRLKYDLEYSYEDQNIAIGCYTSLVVYFNHDDQDYSHRLGVYRDLVFVAGENTTVYGYSTQTPPPPTP